MPGVLDEQVLADQTRQCRAVVRLSCWVLLGCLLVAGLLSLGRATRPVAGVPVAMAVPVVLNLVFHAWQLAKLRWARRQT